MKSKRGKPAMRLLPVLVCSAILLASCSRPEGSRRIPGNKKAFNPVSSCEKVRAFAGKDAELASIQAYFVKSDGTVDMTAEYRSMVIYTFYRPVSVEQVKKGGPLGSGIKEERRSFTSEKVIVTISKPHYYTETINNGEPHTIFFPGMQRTGVLGNDDLSAEKLPPPAFTLDRLWKPALRRGVPEDAVAVIYYDKNGYRFVINDTDIDLRFDADGELLSE